MNYSNPLFLMPALIGPGVILSGLINLYFPARRINSFYGYRTRQSKKSQEKWDFAQRYHAWEMVKWGLLLCLLAIIGLFIELENNWVATIIGFSYAIMVVVLVIARTERAMSKKFKKRIE